MTNIQRFLLWVLCMIVSAALPLRVHADAKPCTFPILHPSRFISGPLTGMSHGATSQGAVTDAEHDVFWYAQGGPPARGRFFVYTAATQKVTTFDSPFLAHGEGIGMLGISSHWLVFSAFKNRYTGEDWQIVVHDRRTGQEHSVASALIGGIAGSELSLDGDMLIWAQPHKPTGGTLEALNLLTGKQRTLASTKEGFYLWPTTSKGHVAWEWMHTLKPGQEIPRNDILLMSESGGSVTSITNDGKGAEPTLNWPRLGYLARDHFGAVAGPLIVQDLHTQQHWQLELTRDDDHPLLGNFVVIYRAKGNSAFYSLITKQRIILTKSEQYVLSGTYIGDVRPSGNQLFEVATPDDRRSYGLAFYYPHSDDPLQDIFTCSKP